MCCGVFHIFDTVPAKHERPVRFGVGVILIENLLVNAHGFIEIIISAKVIGAVVKICFSVVVQPRQSLLCTAAIAHAYRSARLELHRSAAHFTLEN